MDKRYISIKEVLGVVWKGRLFTLICAVILGVVTLTGSFIYENSVTTVSTVVALEWNGLTDGENPDGSRFDYHDMFESYVITQAISGIDVTAEVVRENLTVTPIQPNGVLAIIENALQNGEEISYFASEYQIRIDVGKANITVEEGSSILSDLIVAYRLDFEKKYVQASSVLDFTDANYDDLDYIEIQNVFKSQLDVVKNEMNMKILKVGNFEGNTSSISFNNILVREGIIRSIQYSRLSSKINSNLLTKNESELLNTLRFQKEEKQVEVEIATSTRDMINDLLTNYTGGTTTVIIPGVSSSEDIVLDVYYKELVEQQLVATALVATLEQEVAAMNTMILRYQGLDIEFIVDPLDQLEAETQVALLIVTLDEQLKELVKDTNSVLLEYNAYLISGQITPLMAPQQERNVPLVLYTVVGFIVGAIAGVTITLYKHEWE